MKERDFLDILQKFGVHNIMVDDRENYLKCIFNFLDICYDRENNNLIVKTKLKEFISMIDHKYKNIFYNLFTGSFMNMDTNEMTYYINKKDGLIVLLCEIKKYCSKLKEERLATKSTIEESLLLKNTVDSFCNVLNPFGTLNYGCKNINMCFTLRNRTTDIRMGKGNRQDIRYYYNNDDDSCSYESSFNKDEMRIDVKSYSDNNRDSAYYKHDFLEVNCSDKNNNQVKIVYNLTAGLSNYKKDISFIPFKSLPGAFTYNDGKTTMDIKKYSNNKGENFAELSSCDENNNQIKQIYNLTLGFGNDDENIDYISLQTLPDDIISSLVDIVVEAKEFAVNVIKEKIEEKTYVKK